MSCVPIGLGGNPTLRRNRIHDNKQCGVITVEKGQVILEDNDIIANAFPGIAIKTGGYAVIRHNRVNQNGREAVHVSGGGGGTVEDNDLRGNARGPWNISEDSKPLLKRTRNLED